MENSFQTSFIPKKPVDDVIKRKRKLDLLSVVSISIFVICAIISMLLYGYKVYLLKQKEALSASLEKSRDSFEQETIENLKSFDKKTIAVKEILSQHKMTSPFFAILSDITIPSVQYTNFEYKNDGDFIFVSIEGTARDYQSIAQQSDLFNSTKGRFFSNVVFSDLMKNTTNNMIDFKLDFNIDPSLISYEKNLQANNLETN